MATNGLDRLTSAAERAICDAACLSVELKACSKLTQDPKLSALLDLMARYIGAEATLAHVVLDEVGPMRRRMQEIELALRLPDERPWWRRWLG